MEKYATPQEAQNILRKKFLSQELSQKFWDMPGGSENTAPIKYWPHTLQKHQKEGFLIYINSLSLKELIEKKPFNKKKMQMEDYFEKIMFVITEPFKPFLKNSTFMNDRPEAGYYLLEFPAQYYDIGWDAQNNAIAQFGGKIIRCPEPILAQAIMLINSIDMDYCFVHAQMAPKTELLTVFVDFFGNQPSKNSNEILTIGRCSPAVLLSATLKNHTNEGVPLGAALFHLFDE